MCSVAKIYSSIMNKRLQTYLEKNDLLAEEQNGFRVSRSCIDHVLVLCTVLRNRKALGLDTFVTFVDFQKAFDSVNRDLLLYKLLKIGIRGNFYQSLCAMYKNPRARVVLCSHKTKYFDCPIGVKQGDSISATLFAIYINDLADEIKQSGIGIQLGEGDCLNILMYADDIALLAANENDMQELVW